MNNAERCNEFNECNFKQELQHSMQCNGMRDLMEGKVVSGCVGFLHNNDLLRLFTSLNNLQSII